MLEIGIIVGSTRPGRRALHVAEWVHSHAQDHAGAHTTVLDLAEVSLPLLDEPRPASTGEYAHAHTKAWSAVIAPLDALIIVTPEYNHAPPPALKNALDFLYHEWHNKSVGFVGYGNAGGVRAVEHLRLIAGELHMADVRAQVRLSNSSDFDESGHVIETSPTTDMLTAVLDQTIAWGNALGALRTTKDS
ncbi:MAG: NAD(P)H-dependent oxidoreductase [Demequina sp.]